MTTALALAVALLAATPAAEAPPSALEVRPLAGQPNLHSLGVPEIPPALAALLEQYQSARSAALFVVSPDGEAILIGTRFASPRIEAAGATGARP